MENTTHALHIAVGVLIAIVLIGVVLILFRNIASEKKVEDETLNIHNKTEFNEAILVYDKKLMYGADVLSCLNKAQNNNQKYVYNNYYGVDSSDAAEREEYIVNVTVTLKQTLEEEITVYSKDNGKIVPNLEFFDNTFKPFNPSSVHDYFEIPSVTYYYFDTSNIVRDKTSSYSDLMWSNPNQIKSNTILRNQIINTTLIGSDDGIKYELMATSDSSTVKMGQLSALLSTVTQTEQTIYKSSPADGLNNWYYATWTTAVKKFKTKKFKCTNIHYSDTTGYIDLIEFEEII